MSSRLLVFADCTVALVLGLIVPSCELPDKQVGLLPEPEPKLGAPELCPETCEQRTDCLGEDAYDCLASCSAQLDGLAGACLDAAIERIQCERSLSCQQLEQALGDPGASACAEQVTAEEQDCES